MRVIFILLAFSSMLLSFTQMNLYHDKAQIFKKERLTSNIIHNIPQTVFEEGFVLYSPLVKSYVYQRGESLSLLDVWKSYKDKTVFIKGKKATLRLVQAPHALVEFPDGTMATVKVEEILFPPSKKALFKLRGRIILPKKYAGSEVRYGYLFRGVHWKSFYVLVLSKKDKAWFKGNFEIQNETDSSLSVDSLRLIAGNQNSGVHPPVVYMRKKSLQSVGTENTDENIRKVPLQSYYSYTYRKKIKLPSHSKIFISFLNKHISIVREYTLRLSNPKYFTAERKTIPHVDVSFKAPEALPQGRVIFLNEKRVYLGDAIISNTPKEEKVSLKIGKDFFSVVTERLIKKQRFKDGFRSSVEYTLVNHSKEKRTYKLFVPLHEAKSAAITTTKKYRFKNADIVIFEIAVAAGKQERFEVTYEQRK